jgi:transposase
MALNYRPVDRDQLFLVPPDMRDWLPADHLAWFILEMIEGLDTSVLDEKSRRGGVGREGYAPAMLLGLWVYASARGISSSRQIERACSEDVAFRVLCAQDVPDHTVLARFRQRHQDAMAGLFAQVLALCVGQGLGRFGVIAIDGTKIKANAAKSKTVSLTQLRKLAAAELEKAAVTDAAEDVANTPAAGDDLPPGFGPGSDRKARIEAAIKDIQGQIEAENAPDIEKAQKRLVKAEATLARARQRTADQVKRREAAAAAGKPLGGRRPQADNQPTREALRGVEYARAMLAKASGKQAGQESGVKQAGGKLPKRNTTDPQSRLMKTRDGFMQAYNAQVVVADDQLILAVDATDEVNDLRQLIPMMEQTEAMRKHCEQATGRTDLALGVIVADTGYLSEENVNASGPDRLIAPGRGRVKDDGWAATRDLDQGPDVSESAKAMIAKLDDPENQKLYKRRSVIVEPVNGHLKDRRGLRQFARRGKDAVNAELHLAALTTNLMKLFTTTWQPVQPA